MIFVKKYYEIMGVSIFILFFLVTGFSSLIKKSLTFDESVHITGGYTALSEGDFRINPENGILPQVWSALPLLFIQKDIIHPDKKDRFWREASPWDIANKFLFQSGNDYELIIMLSRIMMLIAAACGGVMLYLISRKIWGRRAGTVSLALFVLSPTIIANSRLVTSDISAAVFFFLSTWTFHLILKRFSFTRLIAVCISISALFLSKMSAPLIIPLLFIITAIRLYTKKPWCMKLGTKYFIIKEQWRQFLYFSGILTLAGAVTFSAIWGFSGFRYSMYADNQGREKLEQRWELILKSDGLPQKTISFAKNYKLFPESYLYGVGYVLYQARMRYAFLNGKYSPVGWWYFFPMTFIMKTPPSLIALFILAILNILSIYSRYEKKRLRILVQLKKVLPFLILIALYLAFSLITNLNIGHRHLLVIYPPLFLLAGGAYYLIDKHFSRKILIWLMLILLLLENIFIYPNYLSYFSPFAGGPSEGYKHLVDSSLDWGQDLKGLKKWLNASKTPPDKTYISYFGTVNLRDYGMHQKKLLCCFEQNSADIFELQEGCYCISATMLQMVYYPSYSHWNNELEKMLTEYRTSFRKLYNAIKVRKNFTPSPESRLLIKKFRLYEKLRFAKLAYFLRKKKTERTIGHSILIFHVTKNELNSLLGQELP
jgi:hypothetical protein